MLRARLARDRGGVRLLDEDGLPAVRARLASFDPPLRGRMIGGAVVLGFADADRLLSGADPVDCDAATGRALANRRLVRATSTRLREATRALLAAGPGLARRAIEDSRLVGRLDDHQAVNVAVMTLAGSYGTCVFDEQGTGKTAALIAAFDLLVERGEAEVLVVVSPKSMVAEWAVEFRRFCGDLYRVAVIDGSRKERVRAVESGADVVVVNYEGVAPLAANLKLLASRSKAILAVDESFFVKNPDARRTDAVREFREWCRRAYVLCGTPAPNSAKDLVAQFDLVDFGHTFEGTAVADDKDLAAAQVRSRLDSHGTYLRNLKSDVLPDLPRRLFTEVGVDLAPLQRGVYVSALDNLIVDLREATDQAYKRRISSFLERRMALLRICSDPSTVVPGYEELPGKFAALDELLRRLVIDEGEKVVVWSFYRASLDRIAGRYGHLGLVRIDGSVPDAAERREAVRSFQEDADTMVFLGNPAAAGAGLTLHRARFAVYESLSNQAAHYLQSLDRIHRRGQSREVEYLTLLARWTIEEDEYRALLAKAERQAGVLRDPPAPRPTRDVLLAQLLDARSRIG